MKLYFNTLSRATRVRWMAEELGAPSVSVAARWTW
jgi:hypothetical protein